MDAGHRERALRLVMHLDQQTIAPAAIEARDTAGCDPVVRRMTGVGDDRQMAVFADERDGG
jgi:hypothetical protein